MTEQINMLWELAINKSIEQYSRQSLVLVIVVTVICIWAFCNICEISQLCWEAAEWIQQR